MPGGGAQKGLIGNSVWGLRFAQTEKAGIGGPMLWGEAGEIPLQQKQVMSLGRKRDAYWRNPISEENSKSGLAGNIIQNLKPRRNTVGKNPPNHVLQEVPHRRNTQYRTSSVLSKKFRGECLTFPLRLR